MKIKIEGVAMSGTPDESDFSGLEEGEAQQAVDIVQAVVAWYTEQIAAERRCPMRTGSRSTAC
ncbi:hypothetical protein [Streptomyces mirabilis]|uniref:hypothetical protein n=1 Tax=Streptomyces mirabilis TaxID=68239 RepID=UPI00331DC60A